MIEESSDGEVDDWRLFLGASRVVDGGVRGGETRCSPFVGDIVREAVEGTIDLGNRT
jgi:hypothetical protein